MTLRVSPDERAIPYRARLGAAFGSVVLHLLSGVAGEPEPDREDGPEG
ncbi:MAG TPA: hypothetical protein VLI67_03105 [Vicinamibacteria bacterium]|nr:hypothetical protein [Vicinamibacteria bacterium]